MIIPMAQAVSDFVVIESVMVILNLGFDKDYFIGIAIVSDYHSVRNTTRMMTSSNGNIFRVTGHLCGEFTGPRWIPRTKASDAELWCVLWSASE